MTQTYQDMVYVSLDDSFGNGFHVPLSALRNTSLGKVWRLGSFFTHMMSRGYARDPGKLSGKLVERYSIHNMTGIMKSKAIFGDEERRC